MEEGDNLAYELDVNYQPIRRYIYGADMDDVEAHVEMYKVTCSFLLFGKSRTLFTSQQILFCLFKFLLGGGAGIVEHAKSHKKLVLKHIANKILSLPK